MSQATLPEFINLPNRYRSLGWRAWREALRDLVAYREVCWWLTKREVVSRYRQSLLGVGWAVLTPLATVGAVVFLKVSDLIGVGETRVPYPLYVYSGLLIWQLFHACLTRGTYALTGQSSLVSRLKFPCEILVLSALGSALFDFCVGGALLAGLMLYYQTAPAWTALLLPLVVLGVLALGLGLALALSVLNVAARDLGRVVSMGATLWLVLTPVFYTPATKGLGTWLHWLNPMSPLVVAGRDLLFDGPRLTFPHEVACALGVGALMLAFGWRLFHVMLPRVAEVV